MNPGNNGYGRATPNLAPNAPTRIAPPEWRNSKLIMSTTSDEVVPMNVYQMKVQVYSGGGSGARYVANHATGGGGGGYASAIINVTPNQSLPTITVGRVAMLKLLMIQMAMRGYVELWHFY